MLKSEEIPEVHVQRSLTYDVVQRLLHWWIALSVVLLSCSGFFASQLEAGSFRSFAWWIHSWIGQFFVLGLILRLVWGLVGSRHARFEGYFFVREWIESLRHRRLMSADGAWGHHPQASATYLGFYGLCVVMMTTGLLLAATRHGEGPFADRFLDDLRWDHILGFVHEWGWYAVVLFVIGHVGALIYHEQIDGIPIAQSMISGFQYRRKKEGGVREKNVFSRDEL